METTQRRFRIMALGCRTNQYEAQAFIDQLSAMGWVAAAEGETADLCIVNTCTVTEGADASSRALIRQLARQQPGAQIVVTGCMAESAPDQLLKIGGVSKVVGNSQKEQLLQQVLPDEQIPEFAIRQFEAHTRAFVKVQDGCNSFCTYCIIPYVRGRSRSRKPQEVLQEVRSLIANGYQEVVITGINVGDYDGGADPETGGEPTRLAELVRMVDQEPGLRRLRISSIDPDEVDAELEQAVLGGTVTCPSMHIVLQSGSNAILKRMNRKYTRQVFLDTVQRLKAACPDFTVTTDIIVGFPGETEEDFQQTCELVREVQFAKVHMFPYSARPRTRAALYPNRVSADVLARRKAELLALAEQTAFALREGFVGRVMEVLTESREEGSAVIAGHTANFLPVEIEDPSLLPNQIVRVRLLSNQPHALKGQLLPSLSTSCSKGTCSCH
jgi:threonylcarbamoyladenosine tRNA methylthiotransferase MtaB